MKLKYYMRGLGIGVLVTVILMSAAYKNREPKAMTDEQVRERAAALGMVDQSDTLLERMPGGERQEEEAGPADTAPGEAEALLQENQTAPDSAGPGGDVESEEEAAPGQSSGEKNHADDKGADGKEADDKQSPPPAENGPEKEKAPSPESGSDIRQEVSSPGKTEASGQENASLEGAEQADTGQASDFTVGSGMSSYGVSKALEDAGFVENASDFDQYLCANGYDSRIRAGSIRIPSNATYEQIAALLTGDR